MPKVLVIEDDVAAAKALCNWLEMERYAVEVATDGRTGYELLRSFSYDLIILDLTLPSMNGLEILQGFRQHGGKTPVILLTGQGQPHEKVLGLDSGADDYVVKPVDLSEISARIRSILRRPPVALAEILRIGNLAIDPASATVTVDEQPVKLTSLQFSLLHFLVSNPDHYFSPEALLERVWKSDIEASPMTVKVCINRIRAEIDKPGRPSLIESARGFGYRVVSNQQGA